MHNLKKLHAEMVFRRYDYLCTLDNLAKLINKRASVDQYNPYTSIHSLGMHEWTLVIAPYNFYPRSVWEGFQC